MTKRSPRYASGAAIPLTPHGPMRPIRWIRLVPADPSVVSRRPDVRITRTRCQCPDPKRCRWLVLRRFVGIRKGFAGGKLERLGARYGVTRERARQIYRRHLAIGGLFELESFRTARRERALRAVRLALIEGWLRGTRELEQY